MKRIAGYAAGLAGAVMAAAAMFATPGNVPAAPQTPSPVQFNRDIRPILSDNCYACHGFDSHKRKADLRLDTKAGLFAKGENGAAVVPGDPAKSLLLSRITSHDPDEVMPPPKSTKKLSPAQIDLLKRWIAEGAAWQEHWSFIAPVRPAVPEFADKAAIRNPIDAFVFSRLEQEGLNPRPEADRETLLRRVTLDLTGLPPTIQELDQFLADKSPDAYEKAVDRLLGSVRHGERLAADWLDAARYADTHGYHIDSGRDMTRWREWVIEAFHQNKKFDQFTVEQLAGDLLPNATLDQKIASGFNRNNMVNFEGGAIAEEYRTAYVIDRVNTTGTVWLGLTVACTQCHDHKYDPMTQKEFYQLFAYFNNITEKGLDGGNGNAGPFISTPTKEQQAKLDEIAASIATYEKQLTGPMPAIDAEQAKWETNQPAGHEAKWTVLQPTEMKSQGGAKLEAQPDHSVLLKGKNPASDVYTIEAPTDVKELTGLRIEALPDKSLKANGPGRSENGNAVLTEIRLALKRGGSAPTDLKLKAATADYSQQEFPASNVIDGSSATGWAIYPEVGKKHELIVETDTAVKLDAADRLVVKIEFKSQFGQHQLGKFRLAATSSASPVSSGKTPAQVAKILATPAEKRTEAQKSELRDFYRQTVSADPAVRDLAGKLAAAKKSRQEISAAIPNTMVMEEMAKPRDTFMLIRGAYDKPGDKVSAGVPAFLPALPNGAPNNRLGLALWLTDRGHPLTSRVLINRYWQMFFGTGIVKTVEDFGTQGEPPSHPALLDWLAVEFMESGWDLRHMIRLMVTSATYRQSAVVTPELLQKDPENRLISRGPRFRLQAEFIRDQALAVSGLLNGQIGGASVSPYQPTGLWEELMSRNDGAKWTAQVYKQSKGEDLYRRTMYTFWKRTCPPPTLLTFDAPDRETCTVRRARTNTPLQALVLMNDPTYVESARKLAERVIAEGGATPEERLTYAYRLVLSRKPKPAEVSVLTSIVQKQREKYAKDEPAALKLLTVGDSPRNEKLNPAELAAWTSAMSVLLNLDEAVTRG